MTPKHPAGGKDPAGERIKILIADNTFLHEGGMKKFGGQIPTSCWQSISLIPSCQQSASSFISMSRSIPVSTESTDNLWAKAPKGHGRCKASHPKLPSKRCQKKTVVAQHATLRLVVAVSNRGRKVPIIAATNVQTRCTVLKADVKPPMLKV